MGLKFVPIPFFGRVVVHLTRKYSVGCIMKCIPQSRVPRDVCYSQCSYLGAKYATDYLKKEFSKCSQAKRPMACRAKINRLLRDWADREVERKLKFEALLRRRLRQAQKKNEKLQQKQQQ